MQTRKHSACRTVARLSEREHAESSADGRTDHGVCVHPAPKKAGGTGLASSTEGHQATGQAPGEATMSGSPETSKPFSHWTQSARKPQIKKPAGSVSRGAGKAQRPGGPGRGDSDTSRTTVRLPEHICASSKGALVSTKPVG